MFNCAAASRKGCVNAKDSHWDRNVASNVAEQLQKNLSVPLDAEKWVCQTLVLNNFAGIEDLCMGNS